MAGERCTATHGPAGARCDKAAGHDGMHSSAYTRRTGDDTELRGSLDWWQPDAREGF